MTHENLNSFIGIGISSNSVNVLWKYCSKGSLQDILENDDIQLDNFFKRSLINDLASGKS